MLLALTFASLLLSPSPEQQQQQPQTPSSQAGAEQTRQVETLLEQGDFKAAEPILKQLAQDHPRDAHVLFDLGFTEEHNNEDQAAAASYTAAIAADPALAEPQVALGLMEARSGHMEQAQTRLRTASELATAAPELRARALRALARLDQAGNPDQARQDLRAAIQLSGEQPGDAEQTALLTAHTASAMDAETSYRTALTRDPNNVAAAVELSSVLQRQSRFADADAVMTPLLAAHPDDPRVIAQTATLYAGEGKTADALTLMQKLRSASPEMASNPALTRLDAHLLLVSGDAAAAEPLYRSLAAAMPDDPTLLDDLGSTLVRQQKFGEAQTVLTRAVAQRAAFHDDAAWGEAAGHLAFAASRNGQPQVVLQALSARATVLPNSPSSLFLQATAHDNLRQKKEAERDYRAFLAAANGKLPDEEFEVRHRLIALEHER